MSGPIFWISSSRQSLLSWLGSLWALVINTEVPTDNVYSWPAIYNSQIFPSVYSTDKSIYCLNLVAWILILKVKKVQVSLYNSQAAQSWEFNWLLFAGQQGASGLRLSRGQVLPQRGEAHQTTGEWLLDLDYLLIYLPAFIPARQLFVTNTFLS